MNNDKMTIKVELEGENKKKFLQLQEWLGIKNMTDVMRYLINLSYSQVKDYVPIFGEGYDFTETQKNRIKYVVNKYQDEHKKRKGEIISSGDAVFMIMIEVAKKLGYDDIIKQSREAGLINE